MSLNILHISDLHFGTNSVKDQQSTRYCDTFVSSFIKELEGFIKELEGKKIDYLIVTGDIANSSKKMEYDKAIVFLEKVVDSLNISKKNVLICMGNHDISWDILRDIEDKEGIPLENLYKEKKKYDNFEAFYNNFYKDKDNHIQQFKTDSIFVEIPDETHKILFLGVNTCYHESNQDKDHCGYIDKVSFETSLKNMGSQYEGYVKCLVMHHNPKDLAQEKHSFDNWREIDKNKLGYPFVVFCGHIHDSDGESEVKSDDNDTIHYISVGSLLKKETTGEFNLYTISDDSSTIQIKYFDFHDSKDPSKQYWQEQDKKKARKKISLKPKVQENEIINDLFSDNYGKAVQELEDKQKQVQKTTHVKHSKTILDEIRNHQLYYSGHFHWDTDENGENSKFRSHGYIDINYLVSHIESLEIITKLYEEKIIEIREKTKLDKTIMVSIGLECSVIGARLSVLFPDFGFSYIPRKHKANDHITVEKEIGFSDYNTVILIKDITFDADEAIGIIEKSFKNKNIHLISLFYCGKKGEKKEILSGKDNAHFYSLIDDIEIPRCNVPESGCPIIKNKLQTIYRC